MRYEEDVAGVCGENWRDTPADERDGALGVAIVSSFMDGCRPSLEDLAFDLLKDAEDTQVSDEQVREFARELDIPYRRLQAAGVFSMRFNARRDRSLNGRCSAREGRTAWCHIAAAASGWVGGGYFVRRQEEGSKSQRRESRQ